MKLLAIETAGDACSCALLVDGESHERFQHAPRRHAELVLSMVEAVLSGAELALSAVDVLAFGRGPGSFTGVRVAAGVVQGLAFGADLPVVPVSSLQAMSQGAYREDRCRRVLAALDARMGEVYWGAYEASSEGLMVVLAPEVVSAPDSVPVPAGEGWVGVGSGWAEYPKDLAVRAGGGLISTQAERLCRARDVATLAMDAHQRGESVSAEQALPVYLRNQVTIKRR